MCNYYQASLATRWTGLVRSWINVIFGFSMISPFLYKRLCTADEGKEGRAIITHWQNDTIGLH